ncbi:hypothetical protein [Donghicola sp. XS_ASV15]|uniref:hypothetical protein n=1 Tax=Donghicola sp. XS_ASV15 TaxID=3241295 RepID=UPI003519BFC4
MISPLLQMALAGMGSDRVPSGKSAQSPQSFENLIASMDADEVESSTSVLAELPEASSEEGESDLAILEEVLLDSKGEVEVNAEAVPQHAQQVPPVSDQGSSANSAELFQAHPEQGIQTGDIAFSDAEDPATRSASSGASIEQDSEFRAGDSLQEMKEIARLESEDESIVRAVERDVRVQSRAATQPIPAQNVAEHFPSASEAQAVVDPLDLRKSAQTINQTNEISAQLPDQSDLAAIRPIAVTESGKPGQDLQKTATARIEPAAFESARIKKDVVMSQDSPSEAANGGLPPSAPSITASGGFGEEASAIAVNTASEVRQSTVTQELTSTPMRAAKVSLTLPQVKEVVQVAVASGLESKIEVELQPLDLGRMKLIFKQDAQGMSVIVEAEKPETIDQIRRHLEQASLDQRTGQDSQPRFRFESGGFEQSGRERQNSARQGKAMRVQTSGDEPLDVANEFSRPTQISPSGSLDIKA